MKKQNKILIAVLAIFVVGMTLGVAFAEPVDAKTFKSKGYKWKIKTSKWKKMKKQAKKEYKYAKKQGRAIPIGYSHVKTVKVYKNGHKTKGYAFAIQNYKKMRCEVRGATSNGAYLVSYRI